MSSRQESADPGGNRVRITMVSDNRAREGFCQEHGLSFWIEAYGRRVLFDAGQGEAFWNNAGRLAIPLATADFIVISHGHYDHTGGLAKLLELAPAAVLVLHPAALEPKFMREDGRCDRVVGMPDHGREAVRALPPGRVRWSLQPMELTGLLGVTGPVPRRTLFEDTGGPFFLDTAGSRPDMLPDDQAVWIKTGAGLIVVTGCSHAGLINTLRHVRQLAGGGPVRAVLGGFHLLAAGPERLHATLTALGELNPELLVPCHCTGDTAIAALHGAYPDKVRTGQAGMSLEFN